MKVGGETRTERDDARGQPAFANKGARNPRHDGNVEPSHLADDLANVGVPMGMLTTGDTVPFHLKFTRQRAFEEIKAIGRRVTVFH